MARYINADKIIEFINNRFEITWTSDDYEGGIKDACCDILEVVERQPTADVKPVVRGEWIREYTLFGTLKDTFWHCSRCGYKNSDSFANFDHKFCPNCGADMRGENDVRITD